MKNLNDHHQYQGMLELAIDTARILTIDSETPELGRGNQSALPSHSSWTKNNIFSFEPAYTRTSLFQVGRSKLSSGGSWLVKGNGFYPLNATSRKGKVKIEGFYALVVDVAGRPLLEATSFGRRTLE